LVAAINMSKAEGISKMPLQDPLKQNFINKNLIDIVFRLSHSYIKIRNLSFQNFPLANITIYFC
jgi:hypothetical protein